MDVPSAGAFLEWVFKATFDRNRCLVFKVEKRYIEIFIEDPFFFLLMILLKIRPLLLLTDLVLELKNSWADSCFSLWVTAGKVPGLSPHSTPELLFCLSPVQLGNCTCLFGHIRFPLVIYAPSLRQWFLMGLFPASLHHWLKVDAEVVCDVHCSVCEQPLPGTGDTAQ